MEGGGGWGDGWYRYKLDPTTRSPLTSNQWNFTGKKTVPKKTTKGTGVGRHFEVINDSLTR